MKGDPQSVYMSIQCTKAEKQILDEAAKRAGKTRNRLLRDWILTLKIKNQQGPKL